MNENPAIWASGQAYEGFMGRWSRKVGEKFVDWLAPQPGANWLEVGCGTGALTTSICQKTQPASVTACDRSPELMAFARRSVTDCTVTFLTASASELPGREGGFDSIVSGLVFNYLPQPLEATRAMRERLSPKGQLAAYVWDYAEGMQFLKVFWEEAGALDPESARYDEGSHAAVCRADGLAQLFEQAGLVGVETTALVIETVFEHFEAYWLPFLAGTGPGPVYVATLNPAEREKLSERLERRLAPADGGPIRLTARAFCTRGWAAG